VITIQQDNKDKVRNFRWELKSGLFLKIHEREFAGGLGNSVRILVGKSGASNTPRLGIIPRDARPEGPQLEARGAEVRGRRLRAG